MSRVRVNSVIRGAQATWLALCGLTENLPHPRTRPAVLRTVYESLDVVLNAYYETYALGGGASIDRGSVRSVGPSLSPAATDILPAYATAELDELLPHALGRAVAAVGAESGSLLLRSDLLGGDRDEWVLTTAVGLPSRTHFAFRAASMARTT